MFGLEECFNDGLEFVYYGLVIGFWLLSAILARYYIKKI